MGRNRIRHDVMIASRTVIPFSSSRCANSTINMLLETTIPTILPDMNYDGLAVADGIQAGIVWTRLIDAATNAEQKTQFKRALLQYCGQDTLALARIVEVLMKLTRTSAD